MSENLNDCPAILSDGYRLGLTYHRVSCLQCMLRLGMPRLAPLIRLIRADEKSEGQ